MIDAFRLVRAAKALRACARPEQSGPELEREWDMLAPVQRLTWLDAATRAVEDVVSERKQLARASRA